MNISFVNTDFYQEILYSQFLSVYHIWNGHYWNIIITIFHNTLLCDWFVRGFIVSLRRYNKRPWYFLAHFPVIYCGVYPLYFHPEFFWRVSLVRAWWSDLLVTFLVGQFLTTIFKTAILYLSKYYLTLIYLVHLLLDDILFFLRTMAHRLNWENTLSLMVKYWSSIKVASA